MPKAWGTLGPWRALAISASLDASNKQHHAVGLSDTPMRYQAGELTKVRELTLLTPAEALYLLRGKGLKRVPELVGG